MIDEINTREDLVELVNEIGFLPFFSGRIEGFSLEENISYNAWYQGRWSGKIHWDAWDWMLRLIMPQGYMDCWL